ncbi:MAG: glycosyltransferase [Deltaproteobacteria bacterium]|nr:glycosyltransferase [Deltaproteobacteria bacterium]
MSCMMEDITAGEKLYPAGKIDDARVFFENIVRENPHHYEAINNLGTILYVQGDIVSAERCYQQSFCLKEDDRDVLLNLADLYFHLKRWNDAVFYLERYLARHSQDVERINQIALAYMELGAHERAIDFLKKSLDINPGQGDILDILKTLQLTSGSTHRQGIRKMKPIVSVGLPVYNGGDLLPQAIESILSQDFGDLELIISDNCSNDKTEEVCRHYQAKDKRVRYYRMDETLGVGKNFRNVLGLAEAPFYMWAAHDDLREKTFISTCLLPLYDDPAVALVYTHTRILDGNSSFIGVHQDPFLVNQEDPKERFINIIWGLGMCNAFYGLFRRSVLKKVATWDSQTTFGDTVQLAEIALMGKFVQISEPLFYRRLTRDYNYRSHDDRNTQLMSEVDPKLFSEGISFPHCRLGYAHLEVLNRSELNDGEKDQLMCEVWNCFRTRYGQQMTYEIDRAIDLIEKGIFYHQWNETDGVRIRGGDVKTLDHFHVTGLLKRLQEVMFFFSEREDLVNAYQKCLNVCAQLNHGQ